VIGLLSENVMEHENQYEESKEKVQDISLEEKIVPEIKSKDMFPIGYYWLSLLKAYKIPLRECMLQEFDE
jgi:hypothetical protein